jgi:membrane protein DedA with SNARE-associated domain
VAEFFQDISRLSPVWVYVIMFGVAYIENIFPPFPSDVVVVFGGALAAMDHGNVFIALFASTLGSTAGFMTMYYIGAWFGVNIIEGKTWKYIPKESIHKVERWFVKYGYAIIIANRFLSGTRAVVSFFAGMSRLEICTTTWLSFVSSLAWYGILIYGGYSLGHHWRRVGIYLETYSAIITGVIICAAIVGAIWYFWKRNRTVQP